MAACSKSEGYRCELIDSVIDLFYCKKCNLVARRSTLTSCCGESYCHACIADIHQQGKPCPECGEENFNIYEQLKYQKRIGALKAYCFLKERGCNWSGALEQLDTHLDPDQDNCQYVDTKCPLNCQQTISKNKVEQHVAQECTKRPHVCQHCGFKATYEEVVDTHLPECKYVPLRCPNRCGVTCEREDMEDHMKICRLEEVGCDFSGVGCDGRFIREDQEEHTRQNSQKHLTLTASLAVETKEQLQQKLLDQDKQHKDEEEKWKKVEEQEKKLVEQEKKLVEQEKKLVEQEKKLVEQKKKLVEQEKKLVEQNEKLEEKLKEQNEKLEKQDEKLKTLKTEHKEEVEQKLTEQRKTVEELFDSKLQYLEKKLLDVTKASTQNNINITKLSRLIPLEGTFEMKNFSIEKAKNKISDWKSPAMYTHLSGYKFCIGVDANGLIGGRGKSIYMDVWTMPGEYDDQLTWPASASFTIELINQKGGANASSTTARKSWLKPSKCSDLVRFRRINHRDGWVAFIEHSELENFLDNNTLYFVVSKVQLFK